MDFWFLANIYFVIIWYTEIWMHCDANVTTKRWPHFRMLNTERLTAEAEQEEEIIKNMTAIEIARLSYDCNVDRLNSSFAGDFRVLEAKKFDSNDREVNEEDDDVDQGEVVEDDDREFRLEASSKKTKCCEMLLSIECILDGRRWSNISPSALIDAAQCEHYLLEPSQLCDLHFSDKHRIELQSLVCESDIRQRYSSSKFASLPNRRIEHEACCIAKSQRECFELNFGAECRATVQPIYPGFDCSQIVALDRARCSAEILRNCPVISIPDFAPTYHHNFFKSNFFLISIAGFVLGFGVLYLVCLRCRRSFKRIVRDQDYISGDDNEDDDYYYYIKKCAKEKK